MDNLHEKLSWKVWVLILFALAVFILVLIFFPLFFSQKTSVSQKNNTVIVQTNPSDYPFPTIVAAKSTPIIPTPYKTSYYTQPHPADWQVATRPVSSGGSYTNFLNSDKEFPRFDIQVSPISPTNSAKIRADALAVYKLNREVIVFRGESAIRLSGRMPFKYTVGNPPKIVSAQKTFLLFDHGGNTYAIDYGYYEDENAEKNKQIILTMLSQFFF